MYTVTLFTSVLLSLSFLLIIPATTINTGSSSTTNTCHSTITSLIQSLQGCANALDPVTATKQCSGVTGHFSTCRNGGNNDILVDILAKLNVTSSQLNDNTKKIDTLLDTCITEPVPVPLPTSCKEIKTKWPNSGSGYYYIGQRTESQPSYVYCHMEELCSSGGGWTRIAYLNMSDCSANCPPGFRLYQSGGVRACGRPSFGNFSCQSVKFPSYGISYTQVCGKVVGYQYASPDAIQHGEWKNPQKYLGGTDPKHNDINSAYVDGISLTHGCPRQHVWTFMCGLTGNKIISDGRNNCPCSPGSPQSSHIQSFVGNDYFCESGANNTWQHKLYTDDPLWDGKGCGSIEQTCCQAPGLPWFHKVLNSTTIDYIEMRVCGDQETDDEDVPVNYYEIYIK